ncbi:hypothetical protein ACHAPJ_012677 [Fusarium lateritium]
MTTDTLFAYNDLDSLSSGGMPPFHANLSKNDTIPSVHGGILWEDSVNKRLFLYGGEYYQKSPQSFDLYSYDILYDERCRRNRWSYFFIPIGDGGMLVYFGGGQDLFGNGTLTPQPLDEIFLCDVANTRWYTQKTSGDTPGNRRRFCGGATWAKDRSSYNIYVFGGGGFAPDTTGYDDIYILTIPSFQWIRGPYPGYRNGTGTYPKSMMSCNVIDNAQMLIIGGSYANATENTYDVPTIQGAHNMNLGKQNEENAIWARYQPNLTTYAVPIDIRTAVGGTGTGGATKTTPVSGFDDPDLAVLMTRTARSGTRTATRSTETSTKKPPPPSDTNKPSSSLSPGGIAGIAVGCSVAFFLALTGCGLLVYRRRKYYSQSHGMAPPPPRNEMTMPGSAAATSPGPSQGGWDLNQSSSPAGTAPSYGGQQDAWRTAAPSELTSGHVQPEQLDVPQRMSPPKNDFSGFGNTPAELAGGGVVHSEYQDQQSPLSGHSHQNGLAS